MPELPEVETVRRVLTSKIIGLKIVDVVSNYPKMVLENFDEFRNKIINKTFLDIDRKGKYLIFKLDDIFLISHLRMEGKFFYVKSDYELNKHIHMIFKLDNGYELRYQDTRKFGIMVTRDINNLYMLKPLSNLSFDANDNSIDKNDLYLKLRNKRCSIKESLLNQEVIAGLGNIYVDEVLFKSKILPNTISSNISVSQCDLILKSSKEILDNAIIYKGTTIRSYTSSLGVKGEYQNFLQIHTKKICPICNQEVKKEKVGGRTTYFCINCQK